MLGCNRIKKIENLHSLCNLDVLDLHSNMIGTIENVAHLAELRVFNLEDNRVQIVNRLEGLHALAELNLRNNQVTRAEGFSKLNHLKRLLLASNRLTSLDDAGDLLQTTHLLELTMDNNPLCNEPFYRQNLINSIRHLRQLDNKRITEEERRTSSKIARKEAERRRETQRVTEQMESRKQAIALVQKKWEDERPADPFAVTSTERMRIAVASGGRSSAVQMIKWAPERQSTNDCGSCPDSMSLTFVSCIQRR